MEKPNDPIQAPSATPVVHQDGEKVYSSVLRVKADPEGITPEERKKNLKALAGAISHNLRRFGEIHVRAMGESATHKAVKAIIVASGNVAVHGLDLYCRPGFIIADHISDNKEMTGISFLVFASSNSSK